MTEKVLDRVVVIDTDGSNVKPRAGASRDERIEAWIIHVGYLGRRTRDGWLGRSSLDSVRSGDSRGILIGPDADRLSIVTTFPAATCSNSALN